MPDSSAIDNALIAKLASDAALLALMSNGVYWAVAPPGSLRFVIVSLVSSHDVVQFGGRAYEENTYLVKAVAPSTATVNMQTAAARIDELLDPQPPSPPATLMIPGYTFMAMFRAEEPARIRETETDERDASIRWFHRGGFYTIQASLG